MRPFVVETGKTGCKSNSDAISDAKSCLRTEAADRRSFVISLFSTRSSLRSSHLSSLEMALQARYFVRYLTSRSTLCFHLVNRSKPGSLRDEAVHVGYVESLINCKPSLVKNFMGFVFDKNYEGGVLADMGVIVLKHLTDHSCIVHFKHKAVWPMASRDFVCLVTGKEGVLEDKR